MLRPKFRIAVLVILLLIAAQFLPYPQRRDAKRDRSRDRAVLFIGNSMTFVHDIPGMVEHFSDDPQCKSGPIRAIRELPPGMYLERHWNDGQALVKLKTEHPAFVVIQEQSDVTLHNLNLRRDYTKRFVEAVRAHEARPILYNIDIGWWTTADRVRVAEEDQRIVRELGVDSINAIQIFTRAKSIGAKLQLFGPDKHHLAFGGSTLVAYALARVVCGSELPFPTDTVAPPEILGDALFPSRVQLTDTQREELLRCNPDAIWPWC